MKASFSLGVILAIFIIAFLLFVYNPTTPRGPIDFAAPTITNFTGTTTIRENLGYVCVVSPDSQTGLQGNCFQAYSGLLKIPISPQLAIPIWTATLACVLIIFFVLFRSRTPSKTK